MGRGVLILKLVLGVSCGVPFFPILVAAESSQAPSSEGKSRPKTSLGHSFRGVRARLVGGLDRHAHISGTSKDGLSLDVPLSSGSRQVPAAFLPALVSAAMGQLDLTSQPNFTIRLKNPHGENREMTFATP